MSIQFGRWNFDGSPVRTEFLEWTAQRTSRYTCDGSGYHRSGPFAVSIQPFLAMDEPDREAQPFLSANGVMLTWDGRLDNHKELCDCLGYQRTSTHGEIVLAAYEKLGKACFGKFIGDWALTLWDSDQQTLFLAKDFIGTRQLFYRLESTRVTWCTVLDPLVLLSAGSLNISEPYVAGYLSIFPATHLTPYIDVHSVPASHFVEITSERVHVQEYWRPDPSKQIRYRKDVEYEHHFRHLFQEAVARRMCAPTPVLAELSGGMDSSSIVCMADTLLAKGKVETPRLDTVSYYDDTEPAWNERPYFSCVEKQRNREGHHLNVGLLEGAYTSPGDDFFSAVPGYDSLALIHLEEFARCLEAAHSRTLLSGIGGDEFLGGVPTPVPELQDLFLQGNCVGFVRQMVKFSLSRRCPCLQLCSETLREFLPQRLSKKLCAGPWLTAAFLARNLPAFCADMQRTNIFGARPSFQAGVLALNRLRRQLNFSHLTASARYRVTYPYLDRDLLEFLMAIPREQLVRPGQRRSLMRRALIGIVPAEVLSRKRKAYVSRHPLIKLAANRPAIHRLLQSPRITACGWVDGEALATSLESACRGESQHMTSLSATLQLELWIQMLVRKDLLCTHAAGVSLASGMPPAAQGHSRSCPSEFNPQGLNVSNN